MIVNIGPVVKRYNTAFALIGDIAQLVERRIRIAKAVGSNPAISTK